MRDQRKARNVHSLPLVQALTLGTLWLSERVICIDESHELKIDTINNEWECSLYLAQSVIPGAGLGVFTTRAYKKGDMLQIPAEITVPVASNSEIDTDLDFMGALQHYHWNSLVYSHHFTQHVEGEAWYDFEFGSGALPNHDVHYVNVGHPERDGIGTLVDDYHRASPGVDAYTPFHHLALGALNDIKEGGELFLDYGPSYFDFRDYGVYLSVPNEASYNEAEHLMKDFLSKRERNSGAAGTTKMEESASNNDTAQTNVADSQKPHAGSLDVKVKEGATSSSSSSIQMEWDTVIENADIRTRSALPKDVTSVLGSNGTAFALEDANRSKEWLEKNGACLDKYRFGASNIIEAGRGGFANTFIKKGEIISPFPVAQLNRTLQVLNANSPYSASPRPSHRLLLNYCMSHPETTLLLCPYSNTVIFNHAPTSFDDKNHNNETRPVANAKVQFTSTKINFKEELLSMSAKDLLNLNNTVGVIYDLVATRDIAPGEEIFMDYGSAWDGAWEEHLKLWRPYVSDIDHDNVLKPLIGSEECRVNFENLAEKENTPLPDCIYYHEEIQERLFNISRENPDHSVTTGCYYKPDWTEMPYQSWLLNIAIQDDFDPTQYRILPWTFASEVESSLGGLFPCQILVEEQSKHRETTFTKEELTYTVMILLDHDENGYVMKDVDLQFVRNVPRRAIRRITKEWRDHPELDHFSMKGSYFPPPFRHYMQIPEEALPESWKDVPKEMPMTNENALHLKNESSVSNRISNNVTDERICDAITMDDGITCS